MEFLENNMEFTNQGVELKSKDFKNLARMFAIAIEDSVWDCGPKHEDRIEAESRLDPVRALLARTEGKDRVLIPAEQLPAIASLAELALLTSGITYDFCETEKLPEGVPAYQHSIPPLLATAHRTMALAADLVEQVYINETFNQLVKPLE